jgi:hypothetical protein
VSFLTTQNFDWVEMEISNTVSLAERTLIYQAFAEDVRIGFPTNLQAPVAPLPVELIAFRGKTVGSAVELTWQTASERNNASFTVERSTAGGNEFRALGQVTGAGNSTSSHSYSFQDAEAAASAAPVLYYRLRQVDTDGKESISPVVAISWKKALTAAKLEVYPNPAIATDFVSLQLPAVPTSGQVVIVYDVRGQAVQQYPATASSMNLPVNSLKAGLYHVTLLDAAGQRVATQRLIVSNH